MGGGFLLVLGYTMAHNKNRAGLLVCCLGHIFNILDTRHVIFLLIEIN